MKVGNAEFKRMQRVVKLETDWKISMPSPAALPSTSRQVSKPSCERKLSAIGLLSKMIAKKGKVGMEGDILPLKRVPPESAPPVLLQSGGLRSATTSTSASCFGADS